MCLVCFFFFKQKTAYEMRISDWSSDVCSSDLTRQVPRQWGWFDLSTHFPWIGMRTAALDGAHVEYFRGIRNPVAVKIGPSVTPDQLLALVDVLNPDDEPGRLSLIHRMGAAHIADRLPPLLDAIRRDGRRVLWVCEGRKRT